MKRKNLSKSEIKELNDNIASYNISFDKKDKIEMLIEMDSTYYFCEGELAFIFKQNIYIPSLKLQIKRGLCLPHCIVDMGAIKFVIGGADIMRPGIVSLPNDLEANSLVVIVDVDKNRPLCVGKLFLSSNEILELKIGKVVANLHYLGDKYWEMSL
jgi:PUA-domain protein